MRTLARLTAVAGLVAGGLTLPGGAAQAAACSGTSGVTVVIDYGSSSTTSCAPGDPSTAMAALKLVVATVVSPQRYPGTVVCRINGTPASDPCIQMPPASAYWAFYHAPRGGSWTYSSAGVTSYNPAPGTAIGFAFGAGARPDVNPPAAASSPKPQPKPSPSSSSSKPPAAKPKPAGTTPAKPGGSSTSSTTPKAAGAVSGSSPSVAPGAKPSTTTALPSDSTSTTSSSSATGTSDSTGSGATTAAAAQTSDSGSPATLLGGLGLVGLVGAGAAYLAVRRRAHP
jgi:hypothetical protein